MSRALGALVRARYQEAFNGHWRFSRVKSGLWVGVMQLAAAAFLLWRLRPAAGSGSLAALLTATLLQHGVWAFIMAFLAGRMQLYGERRAALVMLSPAPPFSPVAALVGFHLGRRLYGVLLWSLALGTLLPAGLRFPGVVLLWTAGAAAGTLGELAGLLLLVAWVRLAPRALGAAWVTLLLLQVCLLWYLIYLLATGLPVAGVLAALGALRGWLLGGAGLLFGLPGLAMLLWLTLAPGRLSQAYREGWLRLDELGDSSSRPLTSRWPVVLPGSAGAVQAVTWLLAVRNPATWFRLGALLLLLSGIRAAAPWLTSAATAHPGWAMVGIGVGLVYFTFGELPAALFVADGPRLGLYCAAGTQPGRVLLGKVTAVLPLLLLMGLATLWVSGQVEAAATAMAVGCGMLAVAVGGGALDLKGGAAGEEAREGALAFLLEQVPRGAGGNLGLVAGGALGVLFVWLLGREVPGALWGLLPVVAVSLCAGYLRLRHLLLRGSPE